MIEHVPLNKIDPNPWQTRSSEDPEHIQQLALSIIDQGLLQIPIGRRVGERVQLAFGHSRLAAYRWIIDVQPTSNVEGDFSAFPVSVRKLTDQEMFELAVRENNDRRNLSAIETARAMLVYRDRFGRSSEEIGRLFGMSDSAVRNKIRLLNLPEEIQTRMDGISEHAARELLFLFDLPEDFRRQAEHGWRKKPSEIVQGALAGERAEKIHEHISNLVDGYGANLSAALWKHDREFDQPDILGPCKGCLYRIQRDKRYVCVQTNCYQAKQAVVMREYLERASQISGIPVNEKEISGDYWDFNNFKFDEDELMTALEVRCPNLRLVYSERELSAKHDTVDGYPRAMIICARQRGRCICQQASKKGVNIAPRVEPKGEPDSQPGGADGDGEATAPVQIEDLEEIAREISRRKRQDAAEVRRLREEMARCIHQAMLDQNPTVWLRLAVKFIPSHTTIQSLKGEQVEKIWRAMAERIALELYNPETTAVPAKALEEYNRMLAEAGLPLLVRVSAETEGASK